MDPESEKLLKLVQPLNVPLLEEISNIAINPNHTQFQVATAFLMEFQANPQAWTVVPTIVEQANHPQTIRYALQILSNLVAHRWAQLPEKQKVGIREFMISFILRLSSTNETLQKSKLILSMANSVLVEIVRQDWPTKWPNFIPDIIAASQSSESACENNMAILSLFSEEVFDFNKEKMTRAKTKLLKEQLTQHFGPIYSLCELILQDPSRTPSLIQVTLEALVRFVTWIPLGYIFETKLIQLLIGNFLGTPLYSHLALECLIEIAGITSGAPPYMFQQLFRLFMNKIPDTLSPNESGYVSIYSKKTKDANLIQRLTVFLTTLFKKHLSLFENEEDVAALDLAHRYLAKFTFIKDKDLSSILLEYWQYLCEGLFLEVPIKNHVPVETERRKFYAPILSQVREALISTMAKPEEILVVVDEHGAVTRERLKNTEQIELYKSMHICLVYLANLDAADTRRIMTNRLEQIHGENFNKHACNTLSWAVGSISGAMDEDHENKFIVKVVVRLIDLCSEMKSKDNRAIIAANVMYVIGQYPRFLRSYWTFLLTVVVKLFEWMKELLPGVQDMACDTFLKIVQSTAGMFVVPQKVDSREPSPPYIETIVDHIPNLIELLDDTQILTFYEAVSIIIKSHKDPLKKQELIRRMMSYPNSSWQEVMSAASHDINFLRNLDTIRNISRIIRTNQSACERLEQAFEGQLSSIFLDMLNVYRVYSDDIVETVRKDGARYLNTLEIKTKRSVKQNILKLISIFVRLTTKPESVFSMIDALLQSVLSDYKNGIPESRDPEVLSLLSELVIKCGSLIVDRIPLFFDAVFRPTIDMITADMTEYPEHRVQFFRFIRSVDHYCFKALLSLPSESFRLVIDGIVWAFRHTMVTVSQHGLTTLLELLQNVERENMANEFYSTYLLSLMEEIFTMMTNGLHKADFGLHARNLAAMFSIVARGGITKPLYDASSNYTDNSQFLIEYTSNLFVRAFPNLSLTLAKDFVVQLLRSCNDLSSFKGQLRDFLVKINDFSSDENDDNSLLYTEEIEAEKAKAAAALMAQQLQIPGMVEVHDPRRRNKELSSNTDMNNL